MIESNEIIYDIGGPRSTTIPFGMNLNFKTVFESESKRNIFLNTNVKDLNKRKTLLNVTVNTSSETTEGGIAINPLTEKVDGTHIRLDLLNLRDERCYAVLLHNIKDSVFIAMPCQTPEENEEWLYEIWVCRSVPILKFNTFLSKKYKGLPILWTTDYSEISVPYLNGKVDEFHAARARWGLHCYDVLKLSRYVSSSSSDDEEKMGY
jgi:hypothetical protein